MRRTRVLANFIYFFAFVLPFFGILNCSGWNSGTMAVSYCANDGALASAYANFYYDLIFASAFLAGIPLVIYILGIVLVTELTVRILRVMHTIVRRIRTR